MASLRGPPGTIFWAGYLIDRVARKRLETPLN